MYLRSGFILFHLVNYYSFKWIVKCEINKRPFFSIFTSSVYQTLFYHLIFCKQPANSCSIYCTLY